MLHHIFHCDLFNNAHLLFQNFGCKKEQKTSKILEKGHYFVSNLLRTLFAHVYRIEGLFVLGTFFFRSSEVSFHYSVNSFYTLCLISNFRVKATRDLSQVFLKL